MTKKRRLVFGPVPSRRLGRSLGIDLLPFKTCSYDCIYCQLGRTTDLTLVRREGAEVSEVVSQLKEALEKGPAPDVITISGSGEPTLSLNLGEVIRAIKGLTEIPVAVLSNGSLLFRPEVRQELMAADVVVPDLDAGDAETFLRINRPTPGLRFEEIVEGLIRFGEVFQGRLLVEVFVAEGVNDAEDEAVKIAAIAGRIRGGRVQLNTVARPTAETFVRPLSAERLRKLAGLFSPPAEIIAAFSEGKEGEGGTSAEKVLEILARRPCTAEDIAAGLAVSAEAADQILRRLAGEGKVSPRAERGKTFYCVCPKS